jgi:hypothetical protein
MGIAPLFCCFKNKSENCIVLTGLGASIVSFAFLIWGLADLTFDRNGVKSIYIITFILVCLCLLGFIALFILLNLKRTESYRTFNTFGKIFSLAIIFLCAIGFIFLFIAFIILIVDYADEEKNIPGQYFPSHEWAAVFLPSLLSLICLIIMALAANILFKVFNDKLTGTPYPVQINQNSMTTYPNIPQPVIYPINNGPVPPMGNNQAYPVVVQESGVNLNK